MRRYRLRVATDAGRRLNGGVLRGAGVLRARGRSERIPPHFLRLPNVEQGAEPRRTGLRAEEDWAPSRGGVLRAEEDWAPSRGGLLRAEERWKGPAIRERVWKTRAVGRPIRSHRKFRPPNIFLPPSTLSPPASPNATVG